MLLLQLKLSRFGNSRRGNIEKVTTAADKKMLKLSKRLLDCPERKDVSSFDGSMMAWVRARSIPSLFRKGVYQIRPGCVEQIEMQLKMFEEDRTELIEKLCAVYVESVLTSKTRLGEEQFNQADYPSLDGLRARFKMQWQYVTLDTPDALKTINKEIFEREKAKLIKMFEEAKLRGIALVREQMKKLVDHLVERLTPDADGEAKIFRASTVDNLKEFLEAFPFRNVSDDGDLEKEVRKLSKLLEFADPEVIRDDDGMREKVRAQFVNMQGRLDKLVEAAPTRVLDFDDEEGD